MILYQWLITHFVREERVLLCLLYVMEFHHFTSWSKNAENGHIQKL